MSVMIAPEYNAMITLSTTHVTKETLDRLHRIANNEAEQDDIQEITVYDKNFHNETLVGCFIYLCSKNCQFETDKTPEDLKNLIDFARFCNANLICLDSDGPQVDNLPVYSHE